MGVKGLTFRVTAESDISDKSMKEMISNLDHSGVEQILLPSTTENVEKIWRICLLVRVTQ